MERTYTYYNNGNIDTITDALNADRTQSIVYDELDRLTSAASTVYGDLNFDYDKIGKSDPEGWGRLCPRLCRQAPPITILF